MKIVFATHNPNKIKEVQAQLPSSISILSLKDIGCHQEIPETSTTLEGNALQKANFVKTNYGYDCFADDTGLEVEALHGAPGVYSARYAGVPKNDQNNINKLLEELKSKPHRDAQFKTSIALLLNNETFLFTGTCKGQILTHKKGNKGFGYDPIFQPKGSHLAFAEMDTDQKNKLSHRGKAIEKLIKHLQKISNT